MRMAVTDTTSLRLEITDAAVDALGATIYDEPLTTPRPLKVPPVAVVALAHQGYEPNDGATADQICNDVRAVAAPVVAAELRRLAMHMCTNDAQLLERRASELEGGAS